MRKLILPLISLLPGVSSGIVVANYSSPVNDRFDNDPSFVGAGLDFSGVGRTTSGRWVTLIGDNYFVTAIHFPATGNVQFLADNDPSGNIFQYTVAGIALRAPQEQSWTTSWLKIRLNRGSRRERTLSKFLAPEESITPLAVMRISIKSSCLKIYPLTTPTISKIPNPNSKAEIPAHHFFQTKEALSE